MRPLLFNLATDVDDHILDFTTGWSTALAKLVISFAPYALREVEHGRAPRHFRPTLGKQ